VVRKIIAQNTKGRAFGLLGEPCVHVLRMNLALDAMSK
jgi:potassium-transporting ATPase KdpC subunit